MAYQFKLQIPIAQDLNNKLKKKASELGFGSITDIARLLLTNFANGNLVISFNNPEPQEKLSNLDLLLAESILEQKSGKTKKINLSKNIHDQLMND
ncbi:MAG: hypothetical protein LW817_01765 [Candidatus Caenarcaniphilales bacterium]|jgi:hypothetical protein|nr:hypothetical protein [Candidatus Caenarcaniphilales bacterium]